jgi:hypothetical protein
MICTNKIVQNIARYESEMVELLVVVVWWCGGGGGENAW